MKRHRKRLGAFGNHPDSEGAAKLVERLSGLKVDSPDIPPLMKELTDWAKKAGKHPGIERSLQRRYIHYRQYSSLTIPSKNEIDWGAEAELV